MFRSERQAVKDTELAKGVEGNMGQREALQS